MLGDHCIQPSLGWLRRHPVDQRSHTPSSGAFGVVGQLLLGLCNPGNIQMNPGGFPVVRNEIAEERAGGEGTRVATGGVDDVGEIALEQLAYFVADREAPDFFASVVGAACDLLRESI